MCALTANNKHQDYCGCVSLLQLHFSEECLARGWIVTEPPTPSLVRWVAAARVCEALWSWVRVRSSVCLNDIDCDRQAQKVRGVKSASGCGNDTFRICERWENPCKGQPGT